MDENICVICSKNVIPSDSSVVVNTAKGLQKLYETSLEKGDELSRKFLDVPSVILHRNCRINYIYKSLPRKTIDLQENINLRNVTPLSKLRSNTEAFDFKNDCIFCGKTANSEYEKKKCIDRRRIVREMKYAELKASQDIALMSGEENHGDLILRLSGVIDLQAVGARYHNDCNLDFHRRTKNVGDQKKTKVGRPLDAEKHPAFVKLCHYMQSNKDSQFTLKELQLKMKEYTSDATYNDQYLQEKLINHFGDKIFVASAQGKTNILCLKKTCEKVVREEKRRSCSTGDHELDIIEIAASIISDELRTQIYSTENYVDLSNETVQKSVPKKLLFFLNCLLGSNVSDENTDVKISLISHAIISYARPRTFISPLLVHISIWLHKKFGSRLLIDMLSKLGVCSSYHEVQKFEISATTSAPHSIEKNAFLQWVFDNADLNQCTLTGKGTFHNMGGIKCITPKSAIKKQTVLPRLNASPKDLKTNCIVPISFYSKPASLGLKKISVKNINVFVDPLQKSVYDSIDALRISTRNLSTKLETSLPWGSYMQVAMAKAGSFKTTDVIYLPFVNLSASDPTAIYSVIKFAERETLAHGQVTTFVTFDLPLYIKGMDIVAASNENEELKDVVVRLGGFHTLMSFLGSIGYIMDGSGLEELWCTVYAPNSVVHMLKGKAFARALRAHILTDDCLTEIAINSCESEIANEVADLINVSEKLTTNEISHIEAAKNRSLIKICEKITEVYKVAAGKSRTSKLWEQYKYLITIVKLYIAAERTADWQLHLYCIKKMIEIYYAAGHFNYAKGAHLYLQSMMELEFKMPPNEYRSFTTSGYFTIRRSSRFWSGCWSDLIIEQTLMRSMKTSGGISRGRGTSENTLMKWTESMPACSKISDALEQFVGVRSQTSEQHLDFTMSRKCNDVRDRTLFLDWLKENSPLHPPSKMLASLSTGLTGDSKVTCDRAVEIGSKLLEATIVQKQNFSDVHCKRNDRVLPLSTMLATQKVREDIVLINTEQIMNRIICLNLDETDKISVFSYELAPICTSLFDKTGAMRTGTKSVLQNEIFKLPGCYVKDMCEIDSDAFYVIDGGFLLHKVVWPKAVKFSTIFQCYSNYILHHYGRNVTIIFDGYEEKLSTKTSAHVHRYKKSNQKVVAFTENMECDLSQADFLSSSMNKTRFISMLSVHLEELKIRTIKSMDDADTIIAHTAMSLSHKNGLVYVISTDTDILIILLARADTAMNVVFIAPGTVKKSSKAFNISDIQNHLGLTSKCLLYLHAMLGCDTTSAPYRRSKIQGLKILRESELMQNLALSFNEQNAEKDAIIKAGEAFLLKMYSSKENDLDLTRYMLYHRMTSINKNINSKFELASLPPTRDAAAQHTLRAYHQVQHWLGRSTKAEDWGWKVSNGRLTPIIMTQSPAPDFIMHMVSCGCTTDCSNIRCSCKKYGIFCTAMCSNCRGIGCLNHDADDILDEDEFIHGEPNETNLDEDEPPCKRQHRN